jgi:hypothetical protein
MIPHESGQVKTARARRRRSCRLRETEKNEIDLTEDEIARNLRVEIAKLACAILGREQPAEQPAEDGFPVRYWSAHDSTRSVLIDFDGVEVAAPRKPQEA